MNILHFSNTITDFYAQNPYNNEILTRSIIRYSATDLFFHILKLI